VILETIWGFDPRSYNFSSLLGAFIPIHDGRSWFVLARVVRRTVLLS